MGQGRQGRQGRNNQCPMPHAPYPIPNAPCPMTRSLCTIKAFMDAPLILDTKS